MLFDALVFFLGIVVLYYGAEGLVKGAAGLALRYGIRPLVVGLTVVALGTSMPEFVVNFFASAAGEDTLALGNIVGSNIANIALILGASALVLPLSVSPVMLRKEYPMMVAAMGALYLMALDGEISRLDGTFLVLGLTAFLVYVVVDARRDARESALGGVSEMRRNAMAAPIWKKVVLLVGGAVLLSVGARLMVVSAVDIADTLGIDKVIVGLTVVAIGTSLPELATSVVSTVNGESDLAVGNAMGSNLLNVLFVVGLITLIQPMHVSAASIDVHLPLMLGFSVLLLPLAWTQHRISRPEGGLLLCTFAGYLVYLVYPYL